MSNTNMRVLKAVVQADFPEFLVVNDADGTVEDFRPDWAVTLHDAKRGLWLHFEVEAAWEHSGLGSFDVGTVHDAMSDLGCPELAEIDEFWDWVRELDQDEADAVIDVLRRF